MKLSKKDLILIERLRSNSKASLKELSIASRMPIATTYNHLQTLLQASIMTCTSLINPAYLRHENTTCYIIKIPKSAHKNISDACKEMLSESYEINDAFCAVEKDGPSVLIITAFTKSIIHEQDLKRRLKTLGRISKRFIIHKQMLKESASVL